MGRHEGLLLLLLEGGSRKRGEGALAHQRDIDCKRGDKRTRTRTLHGKLQEVLRANVRRLFLSKRRGSELANAGSGAIGLRGAVLCGLWYLPPLLCRQQAGVKKPECEAHTQQRACTATGAHPLAEAAKKPNTTAYQL